MIRKLIKPLPRKRIGGLNGFEEAYQEKLEGMRLERGIISYKFEALKFRLADNTFYTPDFMVVYPEHIEFHEIKGMPATDDAIVKFKVVAEMYPQFRWLMIRGKKTRSYYEWETIRSI